MSGRNMTTGEVRSMFREMPELTEPFAHICVVVFDTQDGKDIPYKLIMKQLRAIIPNCCAAVRDSEIVLLATYSDRRFDYPYRFDEISAILRKHRGYMGISNGTRDWSALKMLHDLTLRTVKIALQIEVAAETNIFTFERLGMYLVIDMCARGFSAFTNSDGIMYLAHPAVISLSRYDEENGDTMREVLYFYLFYGQSIACTAERLHMHRNTVMNKVKRICQMLNLNLEDRHLRQRLLFSCQLLRYWEGVNKPETRKYILR